MATVKQRRAAQRNIKKARRAATTKRTIAHLPKSVRADLSHQAAMSRKRGGKAGHNLEDRNRQQLYEVAKRKGIAGRSSMGKWELVTAIRKASQTGDRLQQVSRAGVSRLGSVPAVASGRNDHRTMTAVTIPNMPWLPSTCGRMWQCSAQTPGLSAVNRTS
jgi:hypothetical protein